jgi:hypothetical protein
MDHNEPTVINLTDRRLPLATATAPGVPSPLC